MDGEVITSVGIDIGTSTSQVVFSHLFLKNTSGCFSIPHIAFVDKKLIYASQAHLTPFKTQTTLDDEALRRLVLSEYENAGLKPGDIDAGAVIVTGEAARKENAEMLLNSLSDIAGEFVVSTAGPDLEAIISGKGSGAQQISKARGICVINFDIGGGTTNIAAFDDGEITAKGSLDIGGRQIRVEDGRISYISKSAVKIAAAAGFYPELGEPADPDMLRGICRAMAEVLEQAAGVSPADDLLEEVRTAGSTFFAAPGNAKAVCFSGGVADCIHSTGGDPFRYGDIGPFLGEEIAGSRICTELTPLRGKETIRATVVGAGSYSTTVSGSTISHHGSVLPLKNLPVLKLDHFEQERCYGGDSEYLEEKIKWFLGQNDTTRMVLSMTGERSPSYARLKTLAQCVGEAMGEALPAEAPFLLALENDTAKALGQAIEMIAGPTRAVVCIDSVRTEQGDYIDLGRPIMDGMVIPVVIKTLAFG